MEEGLIKIKKTLYFKSVSKSKKSVMLCTNPNVTQADVARVATLRANKGNNKGDVTISFGKIKAARGFTALPNFGTNYRLSLDLTAANAKDLPQVGDPIELDVFVEQKEDGTTEPGKQVWNERTKKFVQNQFWAYLPSVEA